MLLSHSWATNTYDMLALSKTPYKSMRSPNHKGWSLTLKCKRAGKSEVFFRAGAKSRRRMDNAAGDARKRRRSETFPAQR